MADAPTNSQLILCLAGAAWFLASVILSIGKPTLRAVSTLASFFGLVLGFAALISHAVTRGSWVPLEDNFEALLWLALLTGCVSIYLQLRKTVGRVDWVLSPIVILLLVSAAVFGKTMPRNYSHGLWMGTHIASVFIGPIAFALAAASGVMYLLLTKRLRNKHTVVDARFGSLERLERITYTAVTIGFALLTIGLITGIARAVSADTRLGQNWFWQPKVLLATAAYVLYALVLHSPINPAFRGRRTAILSIAGFILLLGTIGVVQGMK
ncbi:MAG: cytochrome c biogenesis protein CcsA [Burkholderiales bacterium]|nr:cytochrome c biogenesis protein CcsA [Phycisphaerae bacterium]